MFFRVRLAVARETEVSAVDMLIGGPYQDAVVLARVIAPGFDGVGDVKFDPTSRTPSEHVNGVQGARNDVNAWERENKKSENIVQF